MSTRKITSLTLLISFILLMLTSIMLYIAPHGRVAYWSDWHLWGFSRSEWVNLHLNLGVLFLVAFVFHFFFNLKVITAYLKNKAKELRFFTASFNLAFILTLTVCIGTYFMLPPMSLVLGLGEYISERADMKYGEPPYGHAELSSLKIFAKRVNLDLNKVRDLLDMKGIKVAGDSETIGDIARKNKMTAKELFEIMQPAIIPPPAGSSFPDAPPPGFGRKTLADVCAEYNLHIPAILHALNKNNVEADPDMTLREIGETNDMEAMAVFEILHEAASGTE